MYHRLGGIGMKAEDLNSLKKIIELFNEGGLTKLKVSAEGLSVELEKAGIPAPETAAAPKTEEKPAGGELVTVKAPLVGVYYAAPSPDDSPFVSVGDRVSENSTLCLIESMKVFTEIPSGVSGTVEEILVHTGDYVEYDQPLFKIRTGK